MGTAITKTEAGLTCNTAYTRYVWAYSVCGNSIATTLTQVTGICCPTSITDARDGKVYSIVGIGNQCWMAQNLNIGAKVDGSGEQTNNSIIEKYCYNNDDNNCSTYGGLYQWAEMVQYLNGATNTASWNPIPTGDIRGICPSGWHLPTDAEWTTLTTYLGSEAIAGGKMKESGYTHWTSPNIGATNSSGFTALPGGYRSNTALFLNIADYAYFWSLSQNDATSAWARFLFYGNEAVSRNNVTKTYSFSARCVLGCTLPSAPSQGSHIASPTQIIWNWNTVSGAIGYKWNTTNDYGTATDMSTAVTKTETGLTCNTAYTRYVWAYNTCGNSTPVTLTQTIGGCPCPGIPTVTYGGQTYNTVQIGSQCWFRENLNVGMQIYDTLDQTNNGITEKYCYNNLAANCNTYGGLYQWDEAMQYSTTEGVKGICPTGWHLPTDAEWTTLTTFLGGESIAGGKMKEAGLTHWASPNTGATNSSGFTALPGGYRYYYGSFYDLTIDAYFWSSSQTDATHAWYRGLYYSYEDVGRYYGGSKTNGFSGRCVKDN